MFSPPPVALTTHINAHTLDDLATAAAAAGVSVDRLISLICFHASQNKNRLRKLARDAAENEIFRDRSRKWDVGAARRTTLDRQPNFTYPLDKEAKRRIDRVYVNHEYAMSTDLSKPIILVPHKNLGVMSIDGHHRIFKGIVLKKNSLPAHLLTREEARAIRIR